MWDMKVACMVDTFGLALDLFSLYTLLCVFSFRDGFVSKSVEVKNLGTSINFIISRQLCR